MAVSTTYSANKAGEVRLSLHISADLQEKQRVLCTRPQVGGNPVLGGKALRVADGIVAAVAKPDQL